MATQIDLEKAKEDRLRTGGIAGFDTMTDQQKTLLAQQGATFQGSQELLSGVQSQEESLGTATPAQTSVPVSQPIPEPAPTPVETTTDVEATTPVSIQNYTVQAGDTLSAIARKLGVGVNDITGFRSGNPDLIFPQEILQINKRNPIVQPLQGQELLSGKQQQQPSDLSVSNTQDNQNQQVLNDIESQTGAFFSSNDFSINPVGTLKEFVSQVMESLNLPDFNSEIGKITTEIEDLENERDEAIAVEQDNPFLSQSLSDRKIAAINRDSENIINNRVNRLRLLQDVADSARQQSQFALTTAINIHDKERRFQQEQIEFLSNQAEEALKAKEEDLLSVSDAKSLGVPFGTTRDEAARMGIIQQPGTGFNPQQTFQNTLSLRKEFDNQSGDFLKVRDSFARIQAVSAKPSAAGDLALIFNFMKMLDPGSVVRESEFATAQNSAGVPEQIRAQYNKILRGERLSTITRKDFTTQAKQLFDSQLFFQDILRKEFQQTATAFGLNPGQAAPDLTGGGFSANSTSLGVDIEGLRSQLQQGEILVREIETGDILAIRLPEFIPDKFEEL